MTIHTPYNFVPLSQWIFRPDWGDLVSQDIPFEDGISGTLNLEIRAHTPLLVGGRREESTETPPAKVHFFQAADGTPAIPGTSLKGMIRNVLEIASFGKMALVDDRWLSIRDLTPGAQTIYRDKFSENIKPLSRAGFLKLVRDGEDFYWELTRCEFARVEHDVLIEWGKKIGIKNPDKIKKRQNAVKKYKPWEPHLDLKFSLPPEDPHHRSKQITPEHMKAIKLGKGNLRGKLVLTGQPQENKGRKGEKHLEFIFYEPGKPLPMEEEVMRAFLNIHGETDEWKYWKKRLRTESGVPVFYLETGDRPTAMGLAMMFRLAYNHSIGQMLEHTNWRHRNKQNRDLPELLFGFINENQKGLKGRISFGMAKLDSEERVVKKLPVTILNGPKPSYYPAYVDQPDTEKNGVLKKKQYTTYMDQEAELRGWKRYPVRPEIGGMETKNDLERKTDLVAVELFPLEEDTRFKGCVRIHNLRPFELGALVWALTWDQNEALRHALGMGKPFGLGQVSITIDPESRNSLRANKPGETPPSLEFCLELFKEEMEKAWQTQVRQGRCPDAKVTWRESEQLTQLLAMADPNQAPGLPGSTDYMPLEKFREKKGRPHYVLQPYTSYDGPRDRDLFTRVSREEEQAREKTLREAAQREAELAKLPPLKREITQDLQDAASPEERAIFWLGEMETRKGEDATTIATTLRDFYQQAGKWSGKPSAKQKAKNQRIKNVLNQ